MAIYETDFTGVTGGYSLLPEGEHKALVKKVSPMTSKKGHPMVLFELEVGKSKLYHYCLDIPEQDGKPAVRWLFKKTIEAITGVVLPSGKVKIDLDTLIGKTLTVIVGHEMYNGKMSAKVIDVVPQGNLLTPGQEPLIEDNLPF